MDLDQSDHVKPNYFLLYIDDFARALDSKLQVDVAILDWQKHLIKLPMLD